MKHNLSTQRDRTFSAIGAVCTVERRIRAFINGHTDGHDVLTALYGDVAHEPVPERLRAILRG